MTGVLGDLRCAHTGRLCRTVGRVELTLLPLRFVQCRTVGIVAYSRTLSYSQIEMQCVGVLGPDLVTRLARRLSAGQECPRVGLGASILGPSSGTTPWHVICRPQVASSITCWYFRDGISLEQAIIPRSFSSLLERRIGTTSTRRSTNSMFWH